MKAKVVLSLAVVLHSLSLCQGGQNPVVLIPGTVGSRLVDSKTGFVAWGEFSSQAANGWTLKAIQGMAFPMVPDVPLSQLNDGIRSDGPLDIVPVTIAPFLTVNSEYYHPAIQELREFSLSDGASHSSSPCFVFAYDWRRSGDENAAQLSAFLEAKATELAASHPDQYRSSDAVKFDLVTHSHAAVVTRYFLMHGDRQLPADGSLPPITWEGARKVEKVVMMGPPNAGIPRVIRHLTHGYKEHPALPFYNAAIVGTLPSIYQMLPRVRHDCVIDPVTKETIDHFDPEIWVEKKWGLANPMMDRTLKKLLPEVKTREDRLRIALDHQRKCLELASQFQQSVDRPSQVPSHLEFACIGSNDMETDYQYLAYSRKVQIHTLTTGDGTVPIFSTRFFCRHLQQHRHFEDPYEGQRMLLEARHNEFPTKANVLALVVACLMQ